MKSRDLKTIYDLIVTNYRITPIGDGKFLHEFNPKTTDTTYSFIANGIPELIEGERYNIGFKEMESGEKIVDISCISKTSEVNKNISYLYARQMSKEKHQVNKIKNDDRVKHKAKDGYYWGKKYAWREFGLFMSQDAFHQYLDEVGHARIDCITMNPDMPYGAGDASFAYKEEGLEEVIKSLVDSSLKVTKVLFKSPLYSKRFSFKGINAITDKK